MRPFKQWTRKEFEILPDISELDNCPEEADSLVILPTNNLHDSGYRIMYFAVISDNKPICKIAGYSDVIELSSHSPFKQFAPLWHIDCLEVSGLLRIYCDVPIKFYEGSTFEVYPKQ